MTIILIKVFFPPPTNVLSCKNRPSCHCLPLPGHHHRHHHDYHRHPNHDDNDNDESQCDEVMSQNS